MDWLRQPHHAQLHNKRHEVAPCKLVGISRDLQKSFGIHQRVFVLEHFLSPKMAKKNGEKRLFKGHKACNLKGKVTQCQSVGDSRDLRKVLWESPTGVCSITLFIQKQMAEKWSFCVKPT